MNFTHVLGTALQDSHSQPQAFLSKQDMNISAPWTTGHCTDRSTHSSTICQSFHVKSLFTTTRSWKKVKPNSGWTIPMIEWVSDMNCVAFTPVHPPPVVLSVIKFQTAGLILMRWADTELEQQLEKPKFKLNKATSASKNHHSNLMTHTAETCNAHFLTFCLPAAPRIPQAPPFPIPGPHEAWLAGTARSGTLSTSPPTSQLRLTWMHVCSSEGLGPAVLRPGPFILQGYWWGVRCLKLALCLTWRAGAMPSMVSSTQPSTSPTEHSDQQPDHLSWSLLLKLIQLVGNFKGPSCRQKVCTHTHQALTHPRGGRPAFHSLSLLSALLSNGFGI